MVALSGLSLQRRGNLQPPGRGGPQATGGDAPTTTTTTTKLIRSRALPSKMRKVSTATAKAQGQREANSSLLASNEINHGSQLLLGGLMSNLHLHPSREGLPRMGRADTSVAYLYLNCEIKLYLAILD